MGWAPRFGEGTLTEAEANETLLDKATLLETKLDDKIFGGDMESTLSFDTLANVCRLVSQRWNHRLCVYCFLGCGLGWRRLGMGLHSDGYLRNVLPNINPASATQLPRRCTSRVCESATRNGHRTLGMDEQLSCKVLAHLRPRSC